MNRLVATVAGCVLAAGVHADIATDKLPACTKMVYFDQANTAKERNDPRAMQYLIDKGHCFYLKPGTEYSVIDINYPQDPTEWAKIRVYSGDGAAEVYSWYGFVK